MNYEEHKDMLLDSYSVPGSVKTALECLDVMDCVKALNYARTLYHLMRKRVDEQERVAA